MREIREDVRFGPSTGSIVEEAESRDIPFIRLNDQSLVQLGFGVHQKRIQATVDFQNKYDFRGHRGRQIGDQKTFGRYGRSCAERLSKLAMKKIWKKRLTGLAILLLLNRLTAITGKAQRLELPRLTMQKSRLEKPKNIRAG